MPLVTLFYIVQNIRKRGEIGGRAQQQADMSREAEQRKERKGEKQRGGEAVAAKKKK